MSLPAQPISRAPTNACPVPGDAPKGLCNAIGGVYGKESSVERCPSLERRNGLGILPWEDDDQVETARSDRRIPGYEYL